MAETQDYSYQQFLDRVDDIATRWGWDQNKDNVWTPRGWNEHWKQEVPEAKWNGCKPRQRWNAFEILGGSSADLKHLKATIFDPKFPCIERLCTLGFPILIRHYGQGRGWLRLQTIRILEIWAARNLHTLQQRREQAQNIGTLLMKLLTDGLNKLMTTRNVHDTERLEQLPYTEWFSRIKQIALSEFEKPEVNDDEKRQIVAVLGGCYNMVVRTFDGSRRMSVSAKLLSSAYLPDDAAFRVLCRMNLVPIFEADQRDRRTALEARRLAQTANRARQAQSPHVARSCREDEDENAPERPSKRHSSFSQNSSRSNLAPLTILPSTDFPNAPSSPASQVFASPESSPTFSHLASSTHSLPNFPLEPRRTSGSHSFAGHLQHREFESSTYGLARSNAPGQLLHSPQFTAQNRNHSFSSSDSSAFAEPPFALLQRVSTAPQLSTNYQAHHLGNWSPNFSPINFSPYLSHSFSQEIPSPFALPPSASHYPVDLSSSSISSLYSRARRPSTTLDLRRQSAVNAYRPSLTRPDPPTGSETAESLAADIIGKYTRFDAEWGTEVRDKLAELLSDLESEEHLNPTAHSSVIDYLKWLKGVPTVRFLPTPLELPTSVNEAQRCNATSSLAVRRAPALPTFGAPH